MGINKVTVKTGDVNIPALLASLTFAPTVKVGYPQETTGSIIHDEADVPLATLAAWNELGTENSPPRPFMRQGAALTIARRGLATVHVKRLVSGKTHSANFMSFMGNFLKGNIEAAIAAQNFALLEPQTVKAKGSSVILIDSGEMTKNLDVYLEPGF